MYQKAFHELKKIFLRIRRHLLNEKKGGRENQKAFYEPKNDSSENQKALWWMIKGSLENQKAFDGLKKGSF